MFSWSNNNCQLFYIIILLNKQNQNPFDLIMQNQIPFGDLTSDTHRLAIAPFSVYRVAQFSEKTGNDQFDNWLSFYTFRITQPYKFQKKWNNFIIIWHLNSKNKMNKWFTNVKQGIFANYLFWKNQHVCENQSDLFFQFNQ